MNIGQHKDDFKETGFQDKKKLKELVLITLAHVCKNAEPSTDAGKSIVTVLECLWTPEEFQRKKILNPDENFMTIRNFADALALWL